jgi:hypothetical protein
MISSLISASGASNRIAFASSLALRTRTSASARGLRSDKDATSLHRLVDHGSANPSPLIRVIGAENHEIDRNAEIAESFTESHELRAAAFHFGLDDKQIQIAIGATLAPGARAKKDHRGIWSSCCKTAARLSNQGLVSHDLKIVAVRGGGLGSRGFRPPHPLRCGAAPLDPQSSLELGTNFGTKFLGAIRGPKTSSYGS